ncbi:hypothetical protein HHK36_027005 [Tetracentron sinense]|uniref:GATA-type domain-containing protein n=1 Tax=Tetracentron sinense TaxID=13715 RepID=A0A835D606_TETSI|nr:hypothetical protein HHK36_027005 [Tetracentron sinense]
MESLETEASFVDGLLDFTLDIGEEDEEEEKNKAPSSSSLPLDSSPSKNNPQQPAVLNIFDPDDENRSFPEFIEEEDLEWISNVDAFPQVEIFMDILSEKPSNESKRHSPVSVLQNSSSSSSSSAIVSFCGSLPVPVRGARSKRRRRRRSADISGQQLWWWREAKMKNTGTAAMPLTMGRKCEHCFAEKTPQWRAGPLGPKTLCNACGVRFKSGRLVPEYRPASSPSFSGEMHSNSHRKIMEMRRQNQKGMLFKSLDKGYRPLFFPNRSQSLSSSSSPLSAGSQHHRQASLSGKLQRSPSHPSSSGQQLTTVQPSCSVPIIFPGVAVSSRVVPRSSSPFPALIKFIIPSPAAAGSDHLPRLSNHLHFGLILLSSPISQISEGSSSLTLAGICSSSSKFSSSCLTRILSGWIFNSGETKVHLSLFQQTTSSSKFRFPASCTPPPAKSIFRSGLLFPFFWF